MGNLRDDTVLLEILYIYSMLSAVKINSVNLYLLTEIHVVNMMLSENQYFKRILKDMKQHIEKWKYLSQ